MEGEDPIQAYATGLLNEEASPALLVMFMNKSRKFRGLEIRWTRIQRLKQVVLHFSFIVQFAVHV